MPIRWRVSERLMVVSMTCGRVITINTGRLSSFAEMAAAIDSGAMPSLLPKPPPT